MAWNYYWAGTGSAQPKYNQFTYGSCAVGCGPVAWSMLFGWADRQAATGNAYWAPRTGIYRQNGGRGADAVAPTAQDAGVNNMIIEIHNDVHTFCAFGSVRRRRGTCRRVAVPERPHGSVAACRLEFLRDPRGRPARTARSTRS
jgi:hypothetical protein